MAHILFTMADVEMAQFTKKTPIAYEAFDEDGAELSPSNRKPIYGVERRRVRDRQAADMKIGKKIGSAGRKIGAGATYLRRTASGALTTVRNNPGKSALAAAGLAAAVTAGNYLLNRGKKKGKEDYSRQIRTVYFSRSRRHN